MMTKIESPVVVREIGDSDFEWFEDIEDVVFDRFDCCWGASYEGWDSRGVRFEIVRKEREPKWWERLLNQDTSWLEIVHVEEVVSPNFRQIVNESLRVLGINQENDLNKPTIELIERLLQYEFEHTSESYRNRWRSCKTRQSKV